jgi:16S rRNA (cytosine967-C5)-methyltransferase
MLDKELPQTAEKILQAALMGLAKWSHEQVSLDDYLDQDVAPDLRPPVSSMLFEYFRNKALVDRIVSSKCARAPKPRYQRLLAMTVTQCFFQTGISAESAVNIAVDLARRNYGKSTSGFINGVLRNILRTDLEEYQKGTADNPLARFPEILQKRWEQNFSAEELQKMSDAFAQEAPFTFRLTGELSKDELKSIEAKKLPEFAWASNMTFFTTSQCKKLFKKDFLKTGRIYIQDPATVLAPCMADIKGGERILDICAAPGGKTLILAERLKGSGRLVAADRSAKRQELTRENFENHDLNCEIITGSANALHFPAESFDIILLDVPCTNTGVFRHKSDVAFQ